MCVLFTPGTKVSDRRKEKSEVKKINKREEGSWFSLGDSPSYIHVHTHIDEHVFCSAMSQSHNSCLSLLLQLFFLLLLILLPLLFTSFIYLLYLVFPSHFSKKRKQNNKFTRNNRLRAVCVSYVVANVQRVLPAYSRQHRIRRISNVQPSRLVRHLKERPALLRHMLMSAWFRSIRLQQLMSSGDMSTTRRPIIFLEKNNRKSGFVTFSQALLYIMSLNRTKNKREIT